MRKEKHRVYWRLAGLFVFAAVVLAGLAYGMAHVILSGNGGQGEIAPTITAPTVEEYQAAIKPILKPFFEQAVKLSPEDLVQPDPMLVQLEGQTRQSLLGFSMRVPKAATGTHMSFVLLLDKWRRALAGSDGDQATVIDATRQVMADNPWLAE
ncbi:MAG: hypothetical protein PHT12_03460 [Patescibacteria group bacterium]|nr:hypothetical protein [Patescibacteria group bacterium]